MGVYELNDRNDGPQIDKYVSKVKGRKTTNTEPWCGYFVGWVMLMANVPNARDNKAMALAASWFASKTKIVWRKGKNLKLFQPPQPGDLVGYINKKGRIYHIGIIVEWKDEANYYVSIEGNTSWRQTIDRDASRSDGVRIKKRQKDQAYVVANWVG